MNEFFREVLAYGPRYFVEFGTVFSGPKRFMSNRSTLSEQTYREALLFLCISLGVEVFALSAVNVSPGMPWWRSAIELIVSTFLLVGLNAVALRVAWTIVGGKAPLRSFFVLYSYFAGVLGIIGLVFSLVAVGILKGWGSEMLEMMRTRHSISGWSDYWVSWSALWVVAVGYVFGMGWQIAAWGAYREVNMLSRHRSFWAYVLFSILSLATLAVVSLAGVAMLL